MHKLVDKTCIFVYQKGDLVKQPMKSRDVLSKNVPGVGWGGVGGVGHIGVGWVIKGVWWGRWGGSCWDRVGHVGVGWVM